MVSENYYVGQFINRVPIFYLSQWKKNADENYKG
jgi:hypothetical protein